MTEYPDWLLVLFNHEERIPDETVNNRCVDTARRVPTYCPALPGGSHLAGNGQGREAGKQPRGQPEGSRCQA